MITTVVRAVPYGATIYVNRQAGMSETVLDIILLAVGISLGFYKIVTGMGNIFQSTNRFGMLYLAHQRHVTNLLTSHSANFLGDDLLVREKELVEGINRASAILDGKVFFDVGDIEELKASLEDMNLKLNIISRAKIFAFGNVTIDDANKYRRYIKLATSPYAILDSQGNVKNFNTSQAIRAGMTPKQLKEIYGRSDKDIEIGQFVNRATQVVDLPMAGCGACHSN